MAVKPRIAYGELRWMEAFEKLKGLPAGTTLTDGYDEYEFSHALDDPHPPSLWLRVRHGNKRQTRIVRKGDVLILTLRPLR